MATPYFPLLLSSAAIFLFALSDVFAKMLSQDLSPFLISLFRYMGGVMLLGPLLLRRRAVERSTSSKLQILRAFCIFAASVTLIWSIQILPIAQATTLAFTSPFITTLLAVVILRESMGATKVLALLIGVGGAILIADPGFGGFHIAYLAPILSAAFWSGGVIIVKFIRDDSIVTFRFTVVFGTILSLMILPLVMTPISLPQLLIAFFMATCWSGAQMLTVMAYKFGKASEIAPIAFLQIVWSVAFGYILFGETVSPISILGMGFIVISGLLIVSRTR